MIRADMIPDEVVEAAAVERWGISEPTKWELDTCRIIIAAALNAWPGMMPVSEVFTAGGDFYRPHIILPLPQEAKDEKPRRTLDEMRGMFAEAYKHNNRKASDE